MRQRRLAMEKVGAQVAQAALPSVLKTRMNPLSGSPRPGMGPGDIETGGVGDKTNGTNEEENLSLPQRALAKFLRYDLEDKILAFVGVACALAGIVCLATSTMLGVGFIVAALCIGWCFRRINLLELYKSLACSVDTLQAENEELRGHVSELESKLVELNAAVDQLETVKNGLDEQLTTFREINDLVGEQGDEMIKSLNDTYVKYKDENERYAHALSSLTLNPLN